MSQGLHPALAQPGNLSTPLFGTVWTHHLRRPRGLRVVVRRSHDHTRHDPTRLGLPRLIGLALREAAILLVGGLLLPQVGTAGREQVMRPLRLAGDRQASTAGARVRSLAHRPGLRLFYELRGRVLLAVLPQLFVDAMHRRRRRRWRIGPLELTQSPRALMRTGHQCTAKLTGLQCIIAPPGGCENNLAARPLISSSSSGVTLYRPDVRSTRTPNSTSRPLLERTPTVNS